ncbi:MAG TPA: DUF1217 domain-containing protein [Alphaproteobacteria bacterium]
MIDLLGSQFGGVSLPAFPLYQALGKTRDKQFAAFERQPLIEREVAYFLEHAKKVKTVDEFLADRRLMAVALSAFGMEDEIQYLGRMRKVLTEPVADKDSLANKLIDPRFKKIAEAFQFAELGTFNLGLTSFLNDIAAKYKTNEFERFLGEQNPALREVEYFRRNIGDVESTFNILGDRVLREVVTFALRLPREIVFQSVDKQKALVDARVDIEDFQDPGFVDDFIRQYLILKDSEATQAAFGTGAGGTAAGAYVLDLFA